VTPEPTSVAFVTSAWQRDWTVVLDPPRYRMIVASHRHDFPIRLVVLNNFASPAEAARARQAAERLVTEGWATQVVTAETVLTGAVLAGFGLDPGRFWQRNPWFTTAHLAALHVLRGRAQWLCYQSGDVWLDRPAAWVPRALQVLAPEPDVRGLNLCLNIYRDHYPVNCDRETADLWVSAWWGSREQQGMKAPGFCLSDHAYFIPVAPEPAWSFGFTDEELAPFHRYWPPYATPCFEMLYNLEMKRQSFCHAALKPHAVGGPLTKHKSFPKNAPFKLWFYRALGFYHPGGRLATKSGGG
jgi:hypothetical protein